MNGSKVKLWQTAKVRNPDHIVAPYPIRRRNEDFNEWRCSQCLEDWYVKPFVTPSYCPFCGNEIVIDEEGDRCV